MACDCSDPGIARACAAVRDERQVADWCVLEYDASRKNTLVAQKTGDGGVTNMRDYFDDGKCQYGLARVYLDGMAKFCFISWAGRTAPALLRGRMSVHKADVLKVLGPCTAEILAESKDDVTPEKVDKALASAAASSGVAGNTSKINGTATGRSRKHNCLACGDPVFKTQLLEWEGSHFHKACFRCKQCEITLTPETCHRGMGGIFCKEHAHGSGRISGASAACPMCGNGILGESAKLTVKGVSYHPACFHCSKCFVGLEPNMPFGTLSDGKVYCAEHYAALDAVKKIGSWEGCQFDQEDEHQARLRRTAAAQQALTKNQALLAGGGGVAPVVVGRSSGPKKGRVDTVREVCMLCGKSVYQAERMVEGKDVVMHQKCFKCATCGKDLKNVLANGKYVKTRLREYFCQQHGRAAEDAVRGMTNDEVEAELARRAEKWAEDLEARKREAEERRAQKEADAAAEEAVAAAEAEQRKANKAARIARIKAEREAEEKAAAEQKEKARRQTWKDAAGTKNNAKCSSCGRSVYDKERLDVGGTVFHRACMRCHAEGCGASLVAFVKAVTRAPSTTAAKYTVTADGKAYCAGHESGVVVRPKRDLDASGTSTGPASPSNKDGVQDGADLKSRMKALASAYEKQDARHEEQAAKAAKARDQSTTGGRSKIKQLGAGLNFNPAMLRGGSAPLTKLETKEGSAAAPTSGPVGARGVKVIPDGKKEGEARKLEHVTAKRVQGPAGRRAATRRPQRRTTAVENGGGGESGGKEGEARNARVEAIRKRQEEEKERAEEERRAQEDGRVEDTRRQQEEARKAEEAKRAEEERRVREEAERKEREEAERKEAKRAEEERLAREEAERKEAKRAEEERRAREEAERKEAKRAEEERLAEEDRREEARRVEEQRKKMEEEAREEAAEEEDRKAREEVRRKEEAVRRADEAAAAKAEEEQRARAEQRRKEEAARRAEEEAAARQAEAERIAREEALKKEAELQKAEDGRRVKEEFERREQERKAAEEALASKRRERLARDEERAVAREQRRSMEVASIDREARAEKRRSDSPRSIADARSASQRSVAAQRSPSTRVDSPSFRRSDSARSLRSPDRPSQRPAYHRSESARSLASGDGGEKADRRRSYHRSESVRSLADRPDRPRTEQSLSREGSARSIADVRASREARSLADQRAASARSLASQRSASARSLASQRTGSSRGLREQASLSRLGTKEKCALCAKTLYDNERVDVEGVGGAHRTCVRCTECSKLLRGTEARIYGPARLIYCPRHYRKLPPDGAAAAASPAATSSLATRPESSPLEGETAEERAARRAARREAEEARAATERAERRAARRAEEDARRAKAEEAAKKSAEERAEYAARRAARQAEEKKRAEEEEKARAVRRAERARAREENERARGSGATSSTKAAAGPPASKSVVPTSRAASAKQPSGLGGGGDKCGVCNATVYARERGEVPGVGVVHRMCVRCSHCKKTLKPDGVHLWDGAEILCGLHFRKRMREAGK